MRRSTIGGCENVQRVSKMMSIAVQGLETNGGFISCCGDTNLSLLVSPFYKVSKCKFAFIAFSGTSVDYVVYMDVSSTFTANGAVTKISSMLVADS